MSYTTWHTYGYGICVSDIGEPSVERVRNLLEMAPTLRENIQGWMRRGLRIQITMTTWNMTANNFHQKQAAERRLFLYGRMRRGVPGEHRAETGIRRNQEKYSYSIL